MEFLTSSSAGGTWCGAVGVLCTSQWAKGIVCLLSSPLFPLGLFALQRISKRLISRCSPISQDDVCGDGINDKHMDKGSMLGQTDKQQCAVAVGQVALALGAPLCACSSGSAAPLLAPSPALGRGARGSGATWAVLMGEGHSWDAGGDAF